MACAHAYRVLAAWVLESFVCARAQGARGGRGRGRHGLAHAQQAHRVLPGLRDQLLHARARAARPMAPLDRPPCSASRPRAVVFARLRVCVWSLHVSRPNKGVIPVPRRSNLDMWEAATPHCMWQACQGACQSLVLPRGCRHLLSPARMSCRPARCLLAPMSVLRRHHCKVPVLVVK